MKPPVKGAGDGAPRSLEHPQYRDARLHADAYRIRLKFSRRHKRRRVELHFPAGEAAQAVPLQREPDEARPLRPTVEERLAQLYLRLEGAAFRYLQLALKVAPAGVRRYFEGILAECGCAECRALKPYDAREHESYYP